MQEQEQDFQVIQAISAKTTSRGVGQCYKNLEYSYMHKNTDESSYVIEIAATESISR